MLKPRLEHHVFRAGMSLSLIHIEMCIRDRMALPLRLPTEGSLVRAVALTEEQP